MSASVRCCPKVSSTRSVNLVEFRTTSAVPAAMDSKSVWSWFWCRYVLVISSRICLVTAWNLVYEGDGGPDWRCVLLEDVRDIGLEWLDDEGEIKAADAKGEALECVRECGRKEVGSAWASWFGAEEVDWVSDSRRTTLWSEDVFGSCWRDSIGGGGCWLSAFEDSTGRAASSR